MAIKPFSLKINKGLSLLELLVSVAVISIAISVGTGVFIQILKAHNKATVINEVRQNGQLAMAVIERLARNSQKIQLFGSQNVLFLSVNNEYYQLRCIHTLNNTNDYIMLLSSSSSAQITNSDPVYGINVADCTFSTIGGNPQILQVTLKLEQSKLAPSRKDFIANVTLSSSFVTRSITVK